MCYMQEKKKEKETNHLRLSCWHYINFNSTVVLIYTSRNKLVQSTYQSCWFELALKKTFAELDKIIFLTSNKTFRVH